MPWSLILQIFLYLNVFLIGALAMIALQHAYAHFRPEADEPKAKHPAAANVHLPPETRQHLLEQAAANFQKILDNSAAELQHDLTATTKELNKRLEKLGAEILDNEMKHYQSELDDFRQKTSGTVRESQQDIVEYQAKLKTRLTEEIAAEKQRLIDQIDTRLADSVSSFLTEALQHNVDLGAQTPYLTAQLEEHKADFLQEVRDESR